MYYNLIIWHSSNPVIVFKGTTAFFTIVLHTKFRQATEELAVLLNTTLRENSPQNKNPKIFKKYPNFLLSLLHTNKSESERTNQGYFFSNNLSI